jgi:hypothetical protein
MNMRLFLLLFIVFLGGTSFSQQTFCFKVISGADDSEISGAAISVGIGDKVVAIGSTNDEGLFCATFKKQKVSLQISHPFFESFSKNLDPYSFSDTIEVRLKAIKVQIIKDVTVKAPGVPDTVFGSDKLHVQDFEVLPNGDIVLLTYVKNSKKDSEVHLYDGQMLIHSLPVYGKAEELIQDYRHNIHVIGETKITTLLINKKQIGVAQLEKEYFYKYIAPILDTNEMNLYFSNYDANYPEFSYYKYDQEDSIYDKIRTIRDDLMMELYRSEYKWVDVRTKLWAKNLENETGIDAEIWVGANYFTRSIYYQSLYAPFFRKGGELHVFDHYKDSMYTHDLNGQLRIKNPIDYHLNKKDNGWDELIQDSKTEEVYAVYEKSGFSYLGKLDLCSGQVAQKYQLRFKFVEKIIVFGDFVYYVYRPFESMQKRYLYKEKLPFETFANSN